MKTIKLQSEKTAVVRINTNGLNKTRAIAALERIPEDTKKQLHLDGALAGFVFRDMLSKQHSSFVYFNDGTTTLSHSMAYGVITIWQENYTVTEE